MLGMDQRVRVWDRRRRCRSVVAWGWWWLRRADVVSIDVAVMFVRVNVRMRVGKVGKRIYGVLVWFIWRYGGEGG